MTFPPETAPPPETAVSYIEVGLAWFHASKFNGAMEDFTAAIELDPGN